MEHTLSVRVREFIHYTPYSRRGGVLENRISGNSAASNLLILWSATTSLSVVHCTM
ncbi:unnamed protein product [Ectocarpus sp. CCAP 1310/34]|nr:unnamed protein product [Ectocarpus sp. CCAP 1310/34]